MSAEKQNHYTSQVWDTCRVVGRERVQEAEKRLLDPNRTAVAQWDPADPSIFGAPPIEIVDRLIAQTCPGDPIAVMGIVYEAVERGDTDWDKLNVTEDQISLIAELAADADSGAIIY